MSTDRDELRALVAAANGVLAGLGAGAVAALQQATDRGIAHLASTNDRECSCTSYAAGGDGPEVDCDVHGLPSAAYRAGVREGAQEERDQARIRGDLCRWCHREPQRDEQHGELIPAEGGPEVACLGADGALILSRDADEDPLGLSDPVFVSARDSVRRERAAYAAGRAAGSGARPDSLR
jgi:hypothetical protein